MELTSKREGKNAAQAESIQRLCGGKGKYQKLKVGEGQSGTRGVWCWIGLFRGAVS